MRLVLAAAGGVSILLLAAACGGGGKAGAGGTRVVVDRSIGPVAMGMTRARVAALLGRPESTLPLWVSPGAPGTLARYVSHGAPFQVAFGSGARVVSIQTLSSAYRTADGLGPGASTTTVTRLEGFHPDLCELGYWNGDAATPQRGPVTVFTTNGAFVEGVLISELRFYTPCDNAALTQEPRPNVSIGRSIAAVSPGMSEARVERILGQPVARKSVRRGTGVRYSLLGAPFLITYDAAKRVAVVEGYSDSLFTTAGAGPGSPRHAVASLPGFTRDACGLGYWDAAAKPRSSDITVFTVRKNDVASVLIASRHLAAGCAIRSYRLAP